MAKPDHYAVLLAINRYPGLTDLDGPENDARSFRDWLIDPAGGDLDPGHVKCILSSDYPLASDPYDANPTDIALKKVLNQWLKGPDGWVDRVGERLYLFFAGHGFATGSILDPALFTAQAQMSDPQYIPGYRYASKIQNSGFFDEIVRHDDLDLGIALERVAIGEREIVPADDDRRGALGERGGAVAGRHEVAVLVELGEELQARVGGLVDVAVRRREPGGEDALDRLVRGPRIAAGPTGTFRFRWLKARWSAL